MHRVPPKQPSCRFDFLKCSLGHPIVTVALSRMGMLGTTKPTASKVVGVLERLGILSQMSPCRRDRMFRYEAYLEELRTETDLE